MHFALRKALDLRIPLGGGYQDGGRHTLHTDVIAVHRRKVAMFILELSAHVESHPVDGNVDGDCPKGSQAADSISVIVEQPPVGLTRMRVTFPKGLTAENWTSAWIVSPMV